MQVRHDARGLRFGIASGGHRGAGNTHADDAHQIRVRGVVAELTMPEIDPGDLVAVRSVTADAVGAVEARAGVNSGRGLSEQRGGCREKDNCWFHEDAVSEGI